MTWIGQQLSSATHSPTCGWDQMIRILRSLELPAPQRIWWTSKNFIKILNHDHRYQPDNITCNFHTDVWIVSYKHSFCKTTMCNCMSSWAQMPVPHWKDNVRNRSAPKAFGEIVCTASYPLRHELWISGVELAPHRGWFKYSLLYLMFRWSMCCNLMRSGYHQSSIVRLSLPLGSI